MDWETFYERFYDWAPSTRVNRISSLTSFGDSAEVAEIAQEYMDEKAASRLIKKAIAYGVQFTPEEMFDLSGCCDTSAMNALLASSKRKMTQDELEGLWGSVDDDILKKVAARNRVSLFGDDEYQEDVPPQVPQKPSFFAKLAMAIGIAGSTNTRQNHHLGHCTGDCANCPPHYGYRYGRWYYGHDHVHGCEFGGNKGSGGL